LKEQAADRQDQTRQSAALLVLGARPFDFHRSDADAITMLQHLIRRAGLAIDADEIVAGLASDPLLKEFAYGCAFVDFDVVGVAAAVIID
jgi:hypothetical protein